MRDKIKEVVAHIAGTKDREVVDSYTDTLMDIFTEQNTVNESVEQIMTDLYNDSKNGKAWDIALDKIVEFKQQNTVTDEEIFEKSQGYKSVNGKMFFRKGAKWMRDKLTKQL